IPDGGSTRDTERELPPPDETRRTAPALERAQGRDELRRSPAGAARVRHRSDTGDSVLRAAARDPSGPDRVGTDLLHLRCQYGRCTAETAVRPLLYQELLRRPRLLHPVRDDQDGHSEE